MVDKDPKDVPMADLDPKKAAELARELLEEKGKGTNVSTSAEINAGKGPLAEKYSPSEESKGSEE